MIDFIQDAFAAVAIWIVAYAATLLFMSLLDRKSGGMGWTMVGGALVGPLVATGITWLAWTWP